MMKQLSPTDLWALTVPTDITEFTLVNYVVSGLYVMQKNSKSLNAWKIKIPEGTYFILGLCTKDEVLFDGRKEVVCGGQHDDKLWYMDYATEGESTEWFDCWEDSLRSLLSVNGLGWDEKTIIHNDKDNEGLGWQTKTEPIGNNNLLILKKIK